MQICWKLGIFNGIYPFSARKPQNPGWHRDDENDDKDDDNDDDKGEDDDGDEGNDKNVGDGDDEDKDDKWRPTSTT